MCCFYPFVNMHPEPKGAVHRVIRVYAFVVNIDTN